MLNVISDTGILQDLARVMIRDCRYDVSCVSYMFQTFLECTQQSLTSDHIAVILSEHTHTHKHTHERWALR